ncbi:MULTISPECIES: class III extradiol ring-cleavage dioxygenase [Cyanophyceae]|uniref:DODA-type extradiol aromatic ring-opening family dioxygenase n=1 Tax=Cyanophyceae TaxID=3028117 RepID=UPI001686AEDB|nr:MULTISPECIES: class III extradiol ring-cleavage dioxygenase [Cyanophyceae]MBD1918976.1 dioxygenase [Phormidium sp. FACHB-77]MBD2033182.1 dioxygenase [Phormidium sp. FACHB-322]MBD2053885.1 dioxygenase [Leptolyngbya sp. FACHB-60]
MASLPSLFISHGAPDLPLRTGPTQDFLRSLLQTLPKPKAILAISAHWLTAQPTVSAAKQPKTIYDFGGFSQALYELTYPAPGSPKLAEQVISNLADAGYSARVDCNRGFDHGVWTPLILAAPEATIPVVQLSLQPHETPLHHYQLGKALAPLRDEGVLIFASGAATHNLGAFDGNYDAPPPAWAVAFDDWLAEAIATNDIQRLLNYRQHAPYAAKNHPSEEHLLPLFVALGAGGPGQQLHHGFTYGAFSMAAYQFD